eukprot:695643-Karenia_brevis.AAC.1
MSHPSTKSVVLDMCQFGARWRKRTQLACINLEDVDNLHKLCGGRNGVCSRTHKNHIVLSGVFNTPNVLWTSLAQ